MAYYGNYGNVYQPYQNYYPQQQYQQTQIPNLAGRIVNNFDEITANDVPMNGNMAIFPKADLSEIECRQWNANGTISKVAYKPIILENANNSTLDNKKSEYDEIKGQISGIYERLDEILSNMKKGADKE